jgi:hypothetical protein
MPQRVNDARLAELQQLADKATPGEWTYLRDGHDRTIQIAHVEDCDTEECAIGDQPKCLGGHVLLREDSWANRFYDEGSWKFIASTRTAIPDLIADLRDERAAHESAKLQLQAVINDQCWVKKVDMQNLVPKDEFLRNCEAFYADLQHGKQPDTSNEVELLRQQLTERDEQIAHLKGEFEAVLKTVRGQPTVTGLHQATDASGVRMYISDLQSCYRDACTREHRMRNKADDFSEKLAAAEARVLELETEKAEDNEMVQRLAEYVAKLETLGIGCAFCDVKLEGSPIGRNEDALTNIKAHIQVCPNHPLRTLEAQRDALSAALRGFAISHHSQHSANLPQVERVAFEHCDNVGCALAEKALAGLTVPVAQEVK